MAASSRGGHALTALARGNPRVCPQCLHGQRAFYSAVAPVEAGVVASAPEPVPAPATPLQRQSHPPQQYRIKSGVILSRAPLLTRPPTAFESAFYLYQKRLNERLTAPFRKQFFFKRDTAADLDWRLKVRERGGRVSRELGGYRAGTADSWNDEAPLGEKTGSPEALMDVLLADAEMRVSEDGERINDDDRVPVERPAARRSEADEKGDAKRLDREMDRTVYLVVKGKEGGWEFPNGDVRTDENLHETATRVLEQAAGVNMNTWMVGRAPVAHMVTRPVLAADGQPEGKGEKVFFMKARIMAGQADLSANSMGLTDFRWLTAEELEAALGPAYFRSVRGMLAER